MPKKGYTAEQIASSPKSSAQEPVDAAATCYRSIKRLSEDENLRT